MKKLEYTKENLRLVAFIISKATSGSMFTKLLKDASWIPQDSVSELWQVSKKSKEEYLFDEFLEICRVGRNDVLDYILDKVLNKDPIYFKTASKEYKFPRLPYSSLKKKLKIIDSKPMKNNLKLFNERKFHGSVVYVSRDLFKDGHFSQSIFEACKLLDKRVSEISGINKDGKDLMSNAFNKANPKIKMNELQTQSDLDEQEGFMHIYMGVMQGIRNPKGHEIIKLNEPYKALEYLSLISLLFRRLDERK